MPHTHHPYTYRNSRAFRRQFMKPNAMKRLWQILRKVGVLRPARVRWRRARDGPGTARPCLTAAVFAWEGRPATRARTC